MSDFLELLIFLPVVGAIIGYCTKWVAIKMLFHPERWIGIGPIGWQGVAQRRAPKFAAGVADTVTRAGVTVEALIDRIEPAHIAGLLAPAFDRAVPVVLEEVLESVKPGFWQAAAPPARQMLVTQLGQECRRIAASLVTTLKPLLAEVMDVRSVVIGQLSGKNANRLARLFQKVGRRELQVIVWYGAVLGFFIGLLEVGGYAAIERWWLLPLIGAIDGLINNWFAIRMIFRPLERTRYFGVFPFQGLFPARQREISHLYSDVLANEVISARDILSHTLANGASRLLPTAMQTIEREMAPQLELLSMVIGAPVTPEARARAVAVLARELGAAVPELLPKLETYLQERLAVAQTVEAKLVAMPKAEFEEVLRGVFEEDEWILVTLGGFLGLVIGMMQAGVVVFMM